MTDERARRRSLDEEASPRPDVTAYAAECERIRESNKRAVIDALAPLAFDVMYGSRNVDPVLAVRIMRGMGARARRRLKREAALRAARVDAPPTPAPPTPTPPVVASAPSPAPPPRWSIMRWLGR